MGGRTTRRLLLALGIIIAAALTMHFLGGGALRSLGQAIHGR